MTQFPTRNKIPEPVGERLLSIFPPAPPKPIDPPQVVTPMTDPNAIVFQEFTGSAEELAELLKSMPPKFSP